MKVRIGSHTYSPEDGPIRFEVDDEDKAAFRAMGQEQTRITFFHVGDLGAALALDFNPLATDEEALRAHWRAFVDEQDELLETYQPTFQSVLDAQGTLVAAAIERGDDPMTLLATTTLLMEPYAELYEAVMLDYARRTFEAIEVSEDVRNFVMRRFGRKHLHDWHVRQVDDDLLFGWNQAVTTFLQNEGARNVTRINDTTRTWLSGFLGEAQDEGWGPVKAAREARRRWPEPGGPGSRARMENLTRTELLGASNKGSVLGAQSVGERLQSSGPAVC